MRTTGDHASVVPVSVIVCAYTEQRLDDVRACIASIEAQRVAPAEVVVVVDHNPELLRRLGEELTSVRLLASEGPRGLSGARNTGIAHAKSPILAFLDDDARAAPGWLEGIAAAFDDPCVVAVGGRALPRWPGGGRPGWFPEAFDWVVGCSFPGQPATTAPVRNLMGCNMAFRASVLEKAGPFATALGRVGRTPLGCEETELCIRARRAVPEGVVLFAPELVVEHTVTPERARPGYLIRRCFAEGLSKAAVAGLVGARDGLESERRYVAEVLPRAAWQAGTDLVGRRDRQAAGRLLALAGGLAATAAGYLRGRAALAGRPATPA